MTDTWAPAWSKADDRLDWNAGGLRDDRHPVCLAAPDRLGDPRQWPRGFLATA